MAGIKVEICGLCKQKIDMKQDDYCRLTDYRKGKFSTEGFYHLICWKRTFDQAAQMKNKAMALLKRAESFLPHKEEVYEVS